ncbi:M23 family metallopeptidase [Dyella agri]
MKAVAKTLFACFLVVACIAREAWPQSPAPSFDLRLLDAPHAVDTDTGTQVFQELHLANFAAVPLRLSRVDVVDAGNGHVLAIFAGEVLRQRFALIGVPAAVRDPVVPPGRHGVVYIEWTLQGSHPRVIEHMVTYTVPPDTAAIGLWGARTAVSYASGVALGPPLRGGPWVAVHGAGWANGHRRVFNTVDGAARIPGRFAVDWVRVDDAGHLARGDRNLPRNWLGYGAGVLAVADATVAAVRDGMTEAASVSGNPKHSLAEDAGNYVAIRLDDGRYAFYEHLRPGSIAVRPGQRVHRGEVLGALGFTGASTGPHLHFHIAGGPSPTGAEGLPFAFDAFDLLGRYEDLSQLDKAGWTPRRADEAGRRLDEWPAENAVVRFPDQ